MIDAVKIWDSLDNKIINKIPQNYSFDTTTFNTMPDFNKKYLIQTTDEKLMNEYNNEINQFIIDLQKKTDLPHNINNFIFNDIYLGMNELCKDLKLLDSINNGYLFFDEDKFDEKNMYYGLLIIVTSIFSLNLIEDEKTFSFVKIYKRNPLILFFLCCYVFFDNLLDSPDIDKNVKKTVVKYIDHLFKTGKLLDEFNNLEIKYLSTINNIFSILLNYKLDEYPYLYESMYKIFISEVKTSKYQTFEQKEDAKDINIILSMTMDKGKETLIATWQIFYININFRTCDDLMTLSSHMGFIFQLLDDLDDIELDVLEKNITLFSYPYLYQLDDIDEYIRINVTKLINYVLNINEEFKKIDSEYVSTEKKQQYEFAFVIYLNYCIGKNKMLKDMFMEYEYLFPIKYDEIVKIYKQKQSMISQYSILENIN